MSSPLTADESHSHFIQMWFYFMIFDLSTYRTGNHKPQTKTQTSRQITVHATRLTSHRRLTDIVL